MKLNKYQMDKLYSCGEMGKGRKRGNCDICYKNSFYADSFYKVCRECDLKINYKQIKADFNEQYQVVNKRKCKICKDLIKSNERYFECLSCRPISTRPIEDIEFEQFDVND